MVQVQRFKKHFHLVFAVLIALAFAPAQNARAQWVQSNGPYGRSAQSVAAIGASLFAGTMEGGETSGLFRSTDNGVTWALVDGFGGNSVRSLLADGSCLYAGTFGCGVLRSTDSGISWSRMNSGLTTNDLANLSKCGSLLVAGGDDGVFLSRDSAKNWLSVGGPSFVQAVATNGTDIFSGISASGGSPGGVFHMTGGSWSSAGLAGNTVYTMSMLGTTIFAGTGDSGVYRSTDNGTSWKPASAGLPNFAVLVLAVSGSNLFAGTQGGGVFRSTDMGNSWNACNNGLSNLLVLSLSVDGGRLLAGTLGVGVYRSNDSGRSWVQIPNKTSIVENLSVSSNGTDLFAGSGGSGAYRSTDNGSSWQPIDRGLPSVLIGRFVFIDSFVFAVTSSYGVYQSSDNGANWSPSSSCNCSIRGLAAGDSNLYLGTSCFGVYRSTNRGKIWGRCSSGFIGNEVTALAADKAHIFVTTDSGSFRSSDYGVTWLPIDIGPAPIYTTTVAYALNGRDAIAINDAFIFHSTDSGATWVKVDSNSLGYHDPHVVLIGSNVLAATQFGISLSTNFGTSWKFVNAGLIDTDIRSIVIHDSSIYIGTAFSGVWRRPLSEMIGLAAVSQPTATKNELRSYPNPFSQSTTISFTPETSGYAEVSVVNLLGVEVARLFAGEFGAGEHTFTWDAGATGDGCATGMYECLIRMTGRVEKLPVLLVR